MSSSGSGFHSFSLDSKHLNERATMPLHFQTQKQLSLSSHVQSKHQSTKFTNQVLKDNSSQSVFNTRSITNGNSIGNGNGNSIGNGNGNSIGQN